MYRHASTDMKRSSRIKTVLEERNFTVKSTGQRKGNNNPFCNFLCIVESCTNNFSMLYCIYVNELKVSPTNLKLVRNHKIFKKESQN